MKTTEMRKNRRIKLRGAYNFRDLGGYLTSNGRTIHWGKLYRSDNLAHLTKGDLKRLEELNLRSIIDLRSKEERASKPNRLPKNNGIQTINLEISSILKDHNDLKRKLFYGKVGSLDLGAELFKVYKSAIMDYRNELRQFFELLLNPLNYPVIVHCTAGKDRTGVTIALALSALGVSKKVIMEDYMLSKVYLAPMMRRMTIRLRLLSLFRADIAQIKKLFSTQAALLESTFDAIEDRFGSIDACLDDLGMDWDRRRSLMALLTP